MNRTNKLLEIGQALTNPLQGFLNMILYGACTQQCLKITRKCCGKVCPCCAVSEEEQPILVQEDDEQQGTCCFPCCSRKSTSFSNSAQDVHNYVGTNSDDEEEQIIAQVPVQREAAVIDLKQKPYEDDEDIHSKKSNPRHQVVPATTFYDSSHDDDEDSGIYYQQQQHEQSTSAQAPASKPVTTHAGHKRYPSLNEEYHVQATMVPILNLGRKFDTASVTDTIESGGDNMEEAHSVGSDITATQNEISRIISKHKQEKALHNVRTNSLGTHIYASSNE